MPISGVATWTAKASASNDVAAATKAGAAGVTHYCSVVSASLDDPAAVAALQVKDGATVIWEIDVHGALHMPFPMPLQGTAAAALSAELAAGGAGVVGKVSLAGYSA